MGYKFNLREIRKQKGLSQSELAEMLNTGTKRETLSNYENENTVPPLDIAKAIADCLGVSLDYLSGEAQAPNASDETVCKVTGLPADAVANLHQLDNTLISVLGAFLSSDKLGFFLSLFQDAVNAEYDALDLKKERLKPHQAEPVLIPAQGHPNYMLVNNGYLSELFWNQAADALKTIGRNIVKGSEKHGKHNEKDK